MTSILEHDVRRAMRAGILDGRRSRKRLQAEAMDLAEAIYVGSDLGAAECRKAYVYGYVNGASRD